MIRSSLILGLLLATTGQYIPFPRSPVASVAGPCSPFSGYPMNEGSGLTLHDTVGGNDATFSGAGAVTWTSNVIKSGDTSPVFTGSGLATTTNTTIANFSGFTPFSIGVWINLTNSTGSDGIVGNIGTSPAFTGWSFELDGLDRSELFVVNNHTGGNAAEANNPSAVSSGVVRYLVWTYDGSGSTSGMKTYIQALLGTTNSFLNPLTSSAANGTPIVIGARPDGSNPMMGGMGYLALYNCVLTSTQVTTNFAAGPSF